MNFGLNWQVASSRGIGLQQKVGNEPLRNLIIQNFPRFDYMIPADLSRLEEELKRHGLALLRSSDGAINQIARS
jgi:hypothetical protein